MPNRLLIVDDAPFMRCVIRNIAVEAGFNVVAEAGRLSEAIACCQHHSPDIITVDTTLPDAIGLEPLKRLRHYAPQARIVVVANLDRKEEIAEARKLGAVDFVIKPFEKEQLLHAFARV